MSPRIAKLSMLVRLRRRDVDRRARETAQCARNVELAQNALDRATAKVAAAIDKQARALEERLRVPADPVVGWFCGGCHEALEEARASEFQANRAVVGAEQELKEARRLWLRAQARLDAMAAMVARAVSEHRRAGERRRMDAVIDDRRAPVFA